MISDLYTTHIHNLYNLIFSKRDDILKKTTHSLMKAIQIFFNDNHLAIRDFDFYHIEWERLDLDENDNEVFLLLE